MSGFESVEWDRVTGAVSSISIMVLSMFLLYSSYNLVLRTHIQDVIRKVHISKPTKDVRARLMPPASVKLQDEQSKMLINFIDR
jgi:hypothetical protein